MIWYLPAVHVLSGSYLMCLVFVNLIIYLISVFYRKKFGRSSPRTGFLIAIGLSLLSIAALTVSIYSPSKNLVVFISTSIVLSALCSAWNALRLHYIMKKVEK